MSEHRDPVVAGALRRLEVPEHGADFWARLGVELSHDDRSTSASSAPVDDGAAVVDLHERAERPVAERRRASMLAAVAAAAVVVALVAGSSLLRGGGDDRDTIVDVADDPAEIVVPDESVDTSLPDASAPARDAPAAMSADQALANAVEWLDRLLAGDVEDAYGLLDDTSRAAMALGDFELLAAELSEGARAFAGEDISRSVLQVETAAGLVSVVNFIGDVDREGMVETASYPVVLTATGVHHTLGGPQLELAFDEASASGVTLTSPLVMTVGADVPEVWVFFDGRVLEPVEARGRVEIDVEAAAGAGTHLVSLLAVDGGRITARAYTVVVP